MESLVSLIIPNLNSGAYARECASSVLKASHLFKEVIVVDGYSDDGSAEALVEILEHTNKLKFVSRARKGIYDAWNAGIREASSGWIYILPSDDYLIEDAKALSDKATGSGGDVIAGRGMVIGGVNQADNLGDTAVQKLWFGASCAGSEGIKIDNTSFLRALLVSGNCFTSITQVMFRKELATAIPFVEEAGSAGDYATQLAWVHAGAAWWFLPTITGIWRYHSTAASAREPDWRVYEWKLRCAWSFYGRKEINGYRMLDCMQAISGMCNARQLGALPTVIASFARYFSAGGLMRSLWLSKGGFIDARHQALADING